MGCSGIFGGCFFDLWELGWSNEKTLVQYPVECKKSGGVSFLNFSLGTIVFDKITFSWKLRKNFSFGWPLVSKTYVSQKISSCLSSHRQTVCSVDCRKQFCKQNFFNTTHSLGSRPPKVELVNISHQFLQVTFLEIQAKLLVLHRNDVPKKL